MIALRIGLLFVLLLATFPLGKAKAKAKDSHLRWLPSMRIVRLVIIARMAKVVENDFLHLSGELSVWTGLINTAAISVLGVDLVIDSLALELVASCKILLQDYQSSWKNNLWLAIGSNLKECLVR